MAAAVAYCSTSSSSYMDLQDRCNSIPLQHSYISFTCVSPNQHSNFHQRYLDRKAVSFCNLRLRLPFDSWGNRRANARIGRLILGTCRRRFITAVASAEADHIGSDASQIQEAFGRTPLTHISPKKTWEGAIAGLGGCILTTVLLAKILCWPRSILSAIPFGFLIFVGSLFGDLIESVIKRDAGVKDSGSLIPGHGGMLDRVDSYVSRNQNTKMIEAEHICSLMNAAKLTHSINNPYTFPPFPIPFPVYPIPNRKIINNSLPFPTIHSSLASSKPLSLSLDEEIAPNALRRKRDPSWRGGFSLGVDLGLSRTGIALSKGFSVRPLTVLELRGQKLELRLIDIAQKQEVDEFIIGLPKSSDGRETPQSNKVRSVAGRLAVQAAKRGWRVYLQDEYGTSTEAMGHMIDMGLKRSARESKIDAYAAVLVLERYFSLSGQEAELVLPKHVDLQNKIRDGSFPRLVDFD